MSTKQCIVSGLCAAWLGVAGAAAGAALPAPVAAALAKAHLPASSMGAVVMPLAGGTPILAENADEAFDPASAMKLVTSFVALQTLGPAFRWHTDVYTDGQVDGSILRGNLYIQGHGDPLLTFERVWLMLRELRERGIRRVDGDLVLDRSYFILPKADADGTSFDDQPERAYNVAPDALLMNFKALRFDIDADEHRAQVHIEPPLPGVVAVSHFKLDNAPCGAWGAGWGRPEIVTRGNNTRVTLQGRFPRNCSQSRYLGLLDAPDYAGRLTRSLWAELGGSIRGATREGAVPADATRLAEYTSPELAEVIRDMNKVSNNTMARMIYMTLGAEHTWAGHDSSAAADRVVVQWLASHGLSFPELVLDNGSGLSRRARISPRHLAQLLQMAAHDRYGAELISSLPILGVDGTLKHRLADSPLAGAGHIKTGTLDGAKAEAGILRDQNGRDWVVVGLVNHDDAGAAQAALDKLLEWVWQGQGGDPAPARHEPHEALK